MGKIHDKRIYPEIVREERAVTARRKGADLGSAKGLVNVDLSKESVGCESDLQREAIGDDDKEKC